MVVDLIKGHPVANFTSYSMVAKLSDINLSYNIGEEVFPDEINATSQIPVIFLLELLARELKKK
ncbi:hypothetical protein X291_07460 [Oenococcus oeni IOEB_C23]|nr:hypothetical protein X375_04305 [Oenococcus oeni S13]KGH65156.1 hypothetical protein X291_07460 [Oenococcus oeni IOEB_C23]KGH73472.1 hypothetical protein X280_02660 [Oenococcus oeni IOEB_0502]KGH88418.1 hypothetical protein X350_05450 [Oenococcus oeni S12]KGI06796.1 hypothetical protein X297_01900 [Oenococcus oeni IOEB_L40_4]OIK63620.1 hypothetical protein ATW62_00970 [Oenococcus oeni]